MNRKSVIINDNKKGRGIIFLIIVLSILFVYAKTFIKNVSTESTLNNPNSLITQPIVRRDGCTCPLDNNLPIIVIDTNGQAIEPKVEYINTVVNERDRQVRTKSARYPARLLLYEPGDFGYTSICGAEEPTIVGDININIRGQSSLNNPKKQYTIRFKDDKGNENPVELLGMPGHDKWVLNASYGDKSLMRNYLAYKMASQVMEYSPKTRFCEVYLNDENDEKVTFDSNYMGVYLLTEKIERGLERVNIDKNDSKYRDTSFIIARDKVVLGDEILETHWSMLEDDYIIDAYENRKNRTVLLGVYPSASKVTEDEKKRIANYLNEFEYVLRSNNFAHSKNGYRKYIDVNSFVDFAMINEIFKNIDGGEVSTYFYKSIGGLMKAGPVWDFDLTLGNTPVEQVNEPTGFRMVNTIWFDRLFQDSYFANMYSSIRYPYFRKTFWSTKKINRMIDKAVEELGPAVDRNAKRWYIKDTPEDYAKEIDNIKDFLEKRLSWMDNNIHLVKRLVENAGE